MIEAVCYASRPSDASPIAVVVLTDQLHFTGLPATLSPAPTSYPPSPRCSSPPIVPFFWSVGAYQPPWWPSPRSLKQAASPHTNISNSITSNASTSPAPSFLLTILCHRRRINESQLLWSMYQKIFRCGVNFQT